MHRPPASGRTVARGRHGARPDRQTNRPTVVWPEKPVVTDTLNLAIDDRRRLLHIVWLELCHLK